MPRVSVIVPAHNPGALLGRALTSVLSQSMREFECIVIDDGSKQDLSFVERLGDPRVRYFHQPNRGVSVARNVGVLRSRSDYVAFLDQDDEWASEKLERQLESVAATPGAAFYFTGFDWVLPTGVVDGTYRVPITYRGLLRDQHVCLSSLLVSREAYAVVGGHNPLLAQMQDYDLFLRLAMTGAPPCLAPERLVRYHVHGANASADYRTAARERSRLLEEHAARAARAGDRATVAACRDGARTTRDLYGHQAFDQFRSSLGAGRPGSAARHLGTAFALNPGVAVRSLGRAMLQRVQAGVPGRR